MDEHKSLLNERADPKLCEPVSREHVCGYCKSHSTRDPNLITFCIKSSSTNAPGPLASSSKDPEALPKPPKPRVRNFQPSVAYLNRLGIKVRDFAYESTLPPVPTVYLQARQVQPQVHKPLQRKSTEPDDGSQPQSQGTQTLERRLTEPVITPEQSFRTRAFDNLKDYDDLIAANSQQSDLHHDSLSGSQTLTMASTPAASNLTNLLSGPSHGAQVLHVPNTANVTHSTPTSGSSQAAGSESLPHGPDLRHNDASSTFAMPFPSSPLTPLPSSMFSASFPSSPLTPLPSSPGSSPPHGARATPLSSQLSNTLHANTTYEVRSPGAPRVLATSTRYFLRKRPSPSSSATPPSRPTKRLRLTGENSTSNKKSSSNPRAKSKSTTTKSKDKSTSSGSRSRPVKTTSIDEVKGKGKRKKC